MLEELLIKEVIGMLRSLSTNLTQKFFIVLETHTQLNNVKSFWEKIGYRTASLVDAVGHSSGIWILVANNIHQVSIIDYNSQCVTVEFTAGLNSWICSAIYASPTPMLREELWQYLGRLGRSLSKP